MSLKKLYLSFRFSQLFIKSSLLTVSRDFRAPIFLQLKLNTVRRLIHTKKILSGKFANSQYIRNFK